MRDWHRTVQSRDVPIDSAVAFLRVELRHSTVGGPEREDLGRMPASSLTWTSTHNTLLLAEPRQLKTAPKKFPEL